MMLLDTHALLWLLVDDPSLGTAARAAIARADTVHFSSISVSEIAIKHLLGRIELPGGQRFPGIFEEAGLRELPFTARHADALLGEPSLARHDPFDRFLLAQATSERIPLLSADRTLLALGNPLVRDARR